MSDYFMKKFPKPNDISEAAYMSSIKAKACDTLRGLLPLGALTNMGIFANGRAVEYMLTKMYANPLPEAVKLAGELHKEVTPFIENFVERIKSDRGKAYINYLVTSEPKFKSTAARKEILKPSVKLIDYDKNPEIKIAANILFPYSAKSYQILLKNMSIIKAQKVISDYIKNRQGRWHKAGKAFEEIYYTFEIISDIGTYKDLQRHRMNTMLRQLFTTNHGYELPEAVVEAGFSNQYSLALKSSEAAYNTIRKSFLYEAQYLVCHEHLVRWKLKMNLREAFHLCELRSTPQGHPNYRKVAQAMYLSIKKVHPFLGTSMKFVNMENPGLERLSAEVRKEQKLAALTKK